MIKDGRSRVLIVTRNMPPLWGGMEQLNWHMVDELAKRASVRLVSPKGSRLGITPGVEVSEVVLRPLSWFLVSAMAKAVRVARRWPPNVVLAGSGLTAPIAWAAARATGAKAAVYVHGLDVAVGNKFYRWFWLPALRQMDCIIANSRATAELAQYVGVDPAKISVVNPGVAMPTKGVNEGTVVGLRAEKNWDTRALLLSVGRLTNRKGLREFVAEVLPKIVANRPDALLVVVGGVPTNSLHAEAQTIESIRATAAKVGVADNLEFLGVVTDRVQLARVYQAADIHVFPVREIQNDPEGFGMVAVEAAAHGLPTVAYATGGVVDAVAEGVSGHLLPPGNGPAFADAVLRLLDRPLPSEGIRKFAEKFDWACFGGQISSVLLGNKHDE